MSPELSDAIEDRYHKSGEKVLDSLDNLSRTFELWADEQEKVNQITGRIVYKTKTLVCLTAGTLSALLPYAL